MDTWVFGTNLTAIGETGHDPRRRSPAAAEDAYYECYAPRLAEGSVIRIGSAVAAVWFGFIAFGIRFQ